MHGAVGQPALGSVLSLIFDTLGTLWAVEKIDFLRYAKSPAQMNKKARGALQTFYLDSNWLSEDSFLAHGNLHAVGWGIGLKVERYIPRRRTRQRGYLHSHQSQAIFTSCLTVVCVYILPYLYSRDRSNFDELLSLVSAISASNVFSALYDACLPVSQGLEDHFRSLGSNLIWERRCHSEGADILQTTVCETHAFLLCYQYICVPASLFATLLQCTCKAGVTDIDDCMRPRIFTTQVWNEVNAGVPQSRGAWGLPAGSCEQPLLEPPSCGVKQKPPASLALLMEVPPFSASL